MGAILTAVTFNYV